MVCLDSPYSILLFTPAPPKTAVPAMASAAVNVAGRLIRVRLGASQTRKRKRPLSRPAPLAALVRQVNTLKSGHFGFE